jgi:hypothetical protein
MGHLGKTLHPNAGPREWTFFGLDPHFSCNKGPFRRVQTSVTTRFYATARPGMGRRAVLKEGYIPPA